MQKKSRSSIFCFNFPSYNNIRNFTLFCMILSAVRVGERLSTFLTRKRFLPRMKTKMSFQVILISKCLSTLDACKRLLSRMKTEMCFHVTFTRKCPSTSIARKRLLSGMYTNMSSQDTSLGKCLSTFTACIRFSTINCERIKCQIIRLNIFI